MKIEVASNQFVAVLNRVKVRDAVARWRLWANSIYESANSSGNYGTYITAWMESTSSAACSVDEITERDLDRWVNKSDGCKASTRQFRLKALRSFFFFCRAKMFRADDPSELCTVRYKDLDHAKRETRVKRCFTEEEYNQLLDHLRRKPNEFWYAAVIIGRHSALRLGDIAELQWASTADRLVVWTDKTNQRVDLPMTPEIIEVLTSVPMRSKKWCFPTQAFINTDPKRRALLSNQFNRILKYAKISNHHFHELRATKLTEMKASGHTMEQIAEQAGHSSTRTTEGYIVNPTQDHRPAL